MRNPEPPGRRSSIPPAGPDSLRATYERLKPAPPEFTKHKELAKFLADDATETFIIFTSFYVAKSRLSSKEEAPDELLRGVKSRFESRINQIFIELSRDSRGQIAILKGQITGNLMSMLECGGQKWKEKFNSAFSLARSVGKNAERRGATPEETALVVCGAFAASAKFFQHLDKFKSGQFLNMAEKISIEMSPTTLISFLWKFAEMDNPNKARILFEEALRVQRNEQKLVQLLSSS